MTWRDAKAVGVVGALLLVLAVLVFLPDDGGQQVESVGADEAPDRPAADEAAPLGARTPPSVEAGADSTPVTELGFGPSDGVAAPESVEAGGDVPASSIVGAAPEVGAVGQSSTGPDRQASTGTVASPSPGGAETGSAVTAGPASSQDESGAPPGPATKSTEPTKNSAPTKSTSPTGNTSAGAGGATSPRPSNSSPAAGVGSRGAPGGSEPSATVPASSPPASTTAKPVPEASVTTSPTDVATNPKPSNPGDLAGRLYPGWCRSGAPSNSSVPGSDFTLVAPGQSIQAAIDQTSSGVVELAAGVHTISAPLKLKSNVLLRGASRAAVIRTSSSMNNMIELGGGFTGSRSGTLSSAPAFASSITISGGSLSPGLWLIGDNKAGQIVRVLSVQGSAARLEQPLTRDFSGFPIGRQNDPITRSGVERLKLEPKHSVNDLIMIRSAFDVWINNVETDGSGGQVRSAVYLGQSYRVGVYNSDLVTARELGDGGQGYGINVANNSSNVAIEGNRLRRLRHSILLQAGAAGNVVRGNRSEDTRHPNFVEGGPADISFHGYSSGNLVMDNSVERIQINDAGVPGPNNAIVGNTLRVGPLTLDNGVDDLTLLGNIMEGSAEKLRAKTMPSIVAESTAGNPSPQRSYWRQSYDPFGRSGSSGYHRFGEGILDWGSGGNVYVDSSVRSINPCSL